MNWMLDSNLLNVYFMYKSHTYGNHTFSFLIAQSPASDVNDSGCQIYCGTSELSRLERPNPVENWAGRVSLVHELEYKYSDNKLD